MIPLTLPTALDFCVQTTREVYKDEPKEKQDEAVINTVANFMKAINPRPRLFGIF